MTNKKVFSKVLASGGTVLVLMPIFFMLLTAVVGSIARKQILFDYMMPAELSILILVGCGALFWASLREHTLVKAIAWTTGIAFLLLLGCQALAVVTGLAHGEVEVEDARGWVAVITAMLIGYDVCVALLGYWGVRLTKQVFKVKAGDM